MCGMPLRYPWEELRFLSFFFEKCLSRFLEIFERWALGFLIWFDFFDFFFLIFFLIC